MHRQSITDILYIHTNRTTLTLRRDRYVMQEKVDNVYTQTLTLCQNPTVCCFQASLKNGRRSALPPTYKIGISNR